MALSSYGPVHSRSRDLHKAVLQKSRALKLWPPEGLDVPFHERIIAAQRQAAAENKTPVFVFAWSADNEYAYSRVPLKALTKTEVKILQFARKYPHSNGSTRFLQAFGNHESSALGSHQKISTCTIGSTGVHCERPATGIRTRTLRRLRARPGRTRLSSTGHRPASSQTNQLRPPTTLSLTTLSPFTKRMNKFLFLLERRTKQNKASLQKALYRTHGNTNTGYLSKIFATHKD